MKRRWAKHHGNGQGMRHAKVTDAHTVEQLLGLPTVDDVQREAREKARAERLARDEARAAARRAAP